MSERDFGEVFFFFSCLFFLPLPFVRRRLVTKSCVLSVTVRDGWLPELGTAQNCSGTSRRALYQCIYTYHLYIR